MKKTVFIACFALFAGLFIQAPAEAARKSHKPWLSRKEAPQKSVEVRKKQPRVQRVSHATPVLSAKGEKIVQQAKRYEGARYRFGGMSASSGFDCSGLVARVWHDLNLKKVPRASSALYKSGKPVPLAELRPGDLVFFKNTYKRGISHVGIYAGKNKFLHAPGERKRVSITKLSDPYYQLHYAGARRLY